MQHSSADTIAAKSASKAARRRWRINIPIIFMGTASGSGHRPYDTCAPERPDAGEELTCYDYWTESRGENHPSETNIIIRFVSAVGAKTICWVLSIDSPPFSNMFEFLNGRIYFVALSDRSRLRQFLARSESARLLANHSESQQSRDQGKCATTNKQSKKPHLVPKIFWPDG